MMDSDNNQPTQAPRATRYETPEQIRELGIGLQERLRDTPSPPGFATAQLIMQTEQTAQLAAIAQSLKLLTDILVPIAQLAALTIEAQHPRIVQ